MADLLKRNSERESCYAKALFYTNTGYIRNVSNEGFRADFVEPDKLTIGEIVSLKIISDESLQIESFDVKAEIRWMQEKSPYIEVGLQITEIGISAQAEFAKIMELYKKDRSRTDNTNYFSQ